MRIYTDAMEMVREVERDLFEMGVLYQSATVQDKVVSDDPNFLTIELIGYQYMLKDLDDESLQAMVKYLQGNLEWAKEEALERISGSFNPGKAWLLAEQKWIPFIRKDGLFAYHYPERVAASLQAVIRELWRNPDSRQAVVTVYDDGKDRMNWGGLDRVPCSMFYHFLGRNGELTLIYSMRSCDFLKFFATDVYIAVQLLKYVALHTHQVPKCLIHSVSSIHAFKGDMDARGIF